MNESPGDHNFGLDNRQALYRMVGDVFFPDDAKYRATEIECAKEVRKREELDVPLPAGSLDMNALAKTLIPTLPREADWPTDAGLAAKWQARQRQALADVLRIKPGLAVHDRSGPDVKPTTAEKDGVTATFRLLRLGEQWSIPAVEFTRGEAKGTTVVISDRGRSAGATEVERLLAAGQRVLAVDLFYFGESHPKSHAYLWALMLATVGDRALGLQANQLLSIARWARDRSKAPVSLVADGPRSSVIALAAAALEEQAIARVEVIAPLGSLKQLVEGNRTFDQSPELFCFGLLERFDVKHLAALTAPRPVIVRSPDDRTRTEYAGLAGWYRTLGSAHDPLQ